MRGKNCSSILLLPFIFISFLLFILPLPTASRPTLLRRINTYPPSPSVPGVIRTPTGTTFEQVAHLTQRGPYSPPPQSPLPAVPSPVPDSQPPSPTSPGRPPSGAGYAGFDQAIFGTTRVDPNMGLAISHGGNFNSGAWQSSPASSERVSTEYPENWPLTDNTAGHPISNTGTQASPPPPSQPEKEKKKKKKLMGFLPKTIQRNNFGAGGGSG